MDLQRLEKFRDGDPTAFNKIMDEYQEGVYYYLLRFIGNAEDAQDLTQETFVKAYTQRATFRGDSKVGTWIFGIASNLAKNHLRWRGVRRFISPEDALHDPALQNDRGTENLAEQREMELLGYLQMLPKRQRSVFILKYFDELSHAEVSKILGISEGSSRTNFHHAVTRLKEIIQEQIDG